MTKPAAIDPNTFKRAASSFPSGVAVVTSGDGERMRGIIVSAFASLSLPPAVPWSAWLASAS
jgi:flavin reductase (DIM6/NTAB) family NADH-FMN oxidoreductase RutF